ncbi:MAG: hypothetical protein WC091_07160 [Sulfuricellaceae bacterium]
MISNFYRHFLTRLLPVFLLIVTCNGNVFADIAPTTPGCTVSIDKPGSGVNDEVYHCKYKGDAIRQCITIAQLHTVYPMHLWNPSYLSGYKIYYNYGYADYNFSRCMLNEGKLWVDVWGYGGSCGNNSNHTCIWVYFLNPSLTLSFMPSNDCLIYCKSDLAIAKTSITTEAKSILTAYITGTGSLPCGTLICLTGKESFFQPIANGVLLLGTMASTLIVIRKKRKK